jgi:hypothetical protein
VPKKAQITQERVEYNVFLVDNPLKGSKSLKIFKISLTFRFDKSSNVSKSVHTEENSQILTVSNKNSYLCNEIGKVTFFRTRCGIFNREVVEIKNASSTEKTLFLRVELLPMKSRKKYDKAYKQFEDWCREKRVRDITEEVLLAKIKKTQRLDIMKIEKFLREADNGTYLMMKVKVTFM